MRHDGVSSFDFPSEAPLDGFTLFIKEAVTVLVPMILSLAVHEYAHALAAAALGDDTAKTQGRLTLNPVSHIDPLGTLILPLFSVFAATTGGGGAMPFFGWAKPVPYNPLRFRRTISMRLGTVIVAAVGPLSNLVFALLCTAAMAVWFRVSPADFVGQVNPGADLLAKTMYINVSLFFFNLLPLPPLDGSRVLANLLPRRYEPIFLTLERYSFLLFVALLVIPQAFRVIAYPASLLIHQLRSIVFG